MSSESPESRGKPNPEGIPPLEEAEAHDLSKVWEQLGSGIEQELPVQVADAKAMMWAGVTQGFIEQIAPRLSHFKFDEELAEAVRSTDDSTEKAELQRRLANQYTEQLIQERSGWGTTPALSAQTNESLDCVGASALLVIALRDADIEANPGTVWGHKVVLLTDAESRTWYYDPRNGTNGEITTVGTEHEAATLYILSDVEKADLDIPYQHILELPLEDGFMWSMLGNIDVLRERAHTSQTKPEEETDRIYQANRDVLSLRNWEEIRSKLFPHNEQWEKIISHDEQAVATHQENFDHAQEINDRILEQLLGVEADSAEKKKMLSQSIIDDAVTHRDVAWQYLQDELVSSSPLKPETIQSLICYELNLPQPVPKSKHIFWHVLVAYCILNNELSKSSLT